MMFSTGRQYEREEGGEVGGQGCREGEREEEGGEERESECFRLSVRE